LLIIVTTIQNSPSRPTVKIYPPGGSAAVARLRFVVGGLRLWPVGICTIENRSGIRQCVGVILRPHFALLLAALLLSGCTPPVPPANISASASDLPTQAQPRLRTMKIYLGASVLEAELALTPQEVRTGMMFRTNIQETDAMLFVLPYPVRASFWMKNCPESISAAYITADGVIQEIHRLEQNNTNSVVAGRDDIQFVLETKEGWFARHNIGVGTVLRTEHGTLAGTFLTRRP
jgi:uncharacterized protein